MTAPSPTACQSMADVRAGVDAIDRKLVSLLAERMAYMEAAARIKPERGLVRDDARKREVINNACAHADQSGLSAALVASLWDMLVEASIAHEYIVWDALRQTAE